MIVTVRTLANGTNPHYRIPLKVSVTRQLEQFHFEIALTPNTGGAPRRPTRRAARRAVPVAQRAHRHREQRGVDSGKATEGSPMGSPRWRQRSHTGIDSSDNRIFCRNDPFETCSVSKAICSRLRMRHVYDRMERVSR